MGQQSIEKDDHEVAVIMVPFPGQSHLNQLLELAALISSHGVSVHFTGSATHNRQVKTRAGVLKPPSIAKIHFHDFPTPPIATPDPTTDADKSQAHQLPAVLAYVNFGDHIKTLVQKLSEKARRTVIIFDKNVAEAVKDVIYFPNVECYAFYSNSAFFFFYVLWYAMGKPFDVDEDIISLPSVDEIWSDPNMDFLFKPDHFKDRAGDIYNTTRSLEGRFMKLLEREEISGKKKKWAIRPNLMEKLATSISNTKSRPKCFEWLDKQAPRSVVYVCFGSTISLSDEEAREIAIGLEESKHKFIWVLICADKADIFSGEAGRVELPLGFEERVQENGLVVRDWAPQLQILAHESIGGFMSHCGWNSCFESLTMGVPIAAWPMHSDQPFVAMFVTEIVKVGLAVREWAHREELVKASVVKNVVERLIGSEEGGEMRRRAEELSTAIKNLPKGGGGGGEWCEDLENFIGHILLDEI